MTVFDGMASPEGPFTRAEVDQMTRKVLVATVDTTKAALGFLQLCPECRSQVEELMTGLVTELGKDGR